MSDKDWAESMTTNSMIEAKTSELRAEIAALEAERDAARQAAEALRKWGATWREIAWGYEAVENVQIFDNKQQLWASCRPRDCMGRRLDD